jgi:hypothetical protein
MPTIMRRGGGLGSSFGNVDFGGKNKTLSTAEREG